MRQDVHNRELFDQKSSAEDFAKALHRHFNWFSGLPDSVFRRVYPLLSPWYFAPRENHAVAMAFGACLGGRKSAILIQNSGLGLCLDALIGTFRLYEQGLLLIVSNRGILPWEEIQHKDWGQKTISLLLSVDIPFVSFDSEGLTGLERAAQWVDNENKIIALTVNRGNINE
jgi:hypothetical protein